MLAVDCTTGEVQSLPSSLGEGGEWRHTSFTGTGVEDNIECAAFSFILLLLAFKIKQTDVTNRRRAAHCATGSRATDSNDATNLCLVFVAAGTFDFFHGK